MSVRVLIVDDSQAARQVISHYLRSAGCIIAGEAANTTDALRLFRKLQPNLVTLDLMMPRVLAVDSMALLLTVKREMPKVAVIVVSAIPHEKTRMDYLEQGALAYLVKPLTDASFEPVSTKLRLAFPELAAKLLADGVKMPAAKSASKSLFGGATNVSHRSGRR